MEIATKNNVLCTDKKSFQDIPVYVPQDANVLSAGPACGRAEIRQIYAPQSANVCSVGGASFRFRKERLPPRMVIYLQPASDGTTKTPPRRVTTRRCVSSFVGCSGRQAGDISSYFLKKQRSFFKKTHFFVKIFTKYLHN